MVSKKQKKRISKRSSSISKFIPWWAVIVLIVIVTIAGIIIIRSSFAAGSYTCWNQGHRVSNVYSNSSANIIVVNGLTCTAQGYK